MKVAKLLAFPDIFHQGISLQKLTPSPTGTPSNAFVIAEKGETSQPALKQIHQKEVQHALVEYRVCDLACLCVQYVSLAPRVVDAHVET